MFICLLFKISLTLALPFGCFLLCPIIPHAYLYYTVLHVLFLLYFLHQSFASLVPSIATDHHHYLFGHGVYVICIYYAYVCLFLWILTVVFPVQTVVIIHRFGRIAHSFSFLLCMWVHIFITFFLWIVLKLLLLSFYLYVF